MRRLRPLSEAECYARCYGAGDETVRFLKLEPRRSRVVVAKLSGEDLRQAFEQKLEGREAAEQVVNGSEHVLNGTKPAAAA